MLTGWLTDSEGNKYYMNQSNGKMSVGWKQIDNAWYYFNTNGHMMTGWIQVDNKIYYMNPTNGGKMTTGTSWISTELPTTLMEVVYARMQAAYLLRHHLAAVLLLPVV